VSGNRLTFAATLDDRVSKGLKLIQRSFKDAHTQASLFGNLGAMAVAKGFALIDTAISGALGVMGDATRAAIEDEASISKLSASLRANVPAWDGNSDAIERVLQSRMRLGFSDDEQRESLALLVAATHDQTKALELQRTAMDLARFKGISLGQASEALVKVEAGQFRLLKSLGIVLKDGATQQDALTAVQRVATGQGEAYARTTGGRVLAAQVKVNEAMERLGTKLLPVVATTLEQVAEWVDSASRGLSVLAETVGDVGSSVGGFANDATTVLDIITFWDTQTHHFTGELAAQNAALLESTRVMRYMSDATKDDLAVVTQAADHSGSALEGMGGSAEDAAALTDKAMADIVDAVERAASDVEEAANDVAHSMFDPIEDRAKLAELDNNARHQRGIRNQAEAGSKEREESERTLNQINIDTIAVLGKLAAAGDAEAAARLKAMAAAAIASGRLSDSQIADLNKLLLKIRLAEAEFSKLARMSFQASHNKDDTYIPHRAGGGPVYPGEFIVGEEGLEKLRINRDGTGWVTPLAGKAGGTVSLGGSSIGPASMARGNRTLVVPLYINGRQFARATVPDLDEETYWAGQAAGGSTVEN
jgi:hypothetical protein